MTYFEYKVLPAPAKGKKAPGVKSPGARFAFALQELMNEMGSEGWEYLRADILPSEERQGLTSTQTVYRSVLVFRRPLGSEADAQDNGSAAEAPASGETPDTQAVDSEEENENPKPDHASEDSARDTADEDANTRI